VEIERYNFLCSLIIDCAAYRIGGPAIHARIISQNLPLIQQHYPEQAWTHDRVRHLFETNGLLDTIRPRRVEFVVEQGQAELRLKRHSDEIQMLLARIAQILKMIKR
jgi:hypothetical protein